MATTREWVKINTVTTLTVLVAVLVAIALLVYEIHTR